MAISRLKRLIGELKRRRVFRVAAVCAVVAFVIWQSAEIAVPGLNLPHWVLTLIILLTVLGFPIALVLAWALEMTPEGVRVTSPAAPPEANAGRGVDHRPGHRARKARHGTRPHRRPALRRGFAVCQPER